MILTHLEATRCLARLAASPKFPDNLGIHAATNYLGRPGATLLFSPGAGGKLPPSVGRVAVAAIKNNEAESGSFPLRPASRPGLENLGQLVWYFRLPLGPSRDLGVNRQLPWTGLFIFDNRRNFPWRTNSLTSY